MNNKLILTIYIFLLSQLAFASPSDNLRERVYVQTDKQEYLAGELLWLKVLTTNLAGKPLNFSKVVYVELLDRSSSLVQAKIEMTDGVGFGTLVFPANLSTGNYRLVAYTNYNKNEPASVFFEKTIAVINPFEVTKRQTENNTSTVIPLNNEKSTFSLSVDKPEYSSRNLVEIKLEGLPHDIHTLAVSVSGVPLLNQSRQSNFQLWKDNLQNTNAVEFTNNYIPEYEGHIITAKVNSISDSQIVENDVVVPYIGIVGNDDILAFAGKTDNEGNAYFFTNGIKGQKELVSTVNSIAGLDYRVDIQSPFVFDHQSKTLPAIGAIGNQLAEKYLERSVGVQAMYSLVTDSINKFASTAPFFNYKPDKTYVMDEWVRFPTMPEVVTEIVTYLRFRKHNNNYFFSIYREGLGFSNIMPLVLIDGIPVLDHNIVYNYDPHLMKQIDLYYDRFVVGGNFFDGIVSFTTNKGDYTGFKADKSTLFVNYEGTQPERLFYSPEYKTDAERKSRLPDFRHTLYWNPEIDVDGSQTIEIPFYTSDLKGDFKVSVEGITKDGKIVYATTTFKVK